VQTFDQCGSCDLGCQGFADTYGLLPHEVGCAKGRCVARFDFTIREDCGYLCYQSGLGCSVEPKNAPTWWDPPICVSSDPTKTLGFDNVGTLTSQCVVYNGPEEYWRIGGDCDTPPHVSYWDELPNGGHEYYYFERQWCTCGADPKFFSD
jgi:hypothetical protein